MPKADHPDPKQVEINGVYTKDVYEVLKWQGCATWSEFKFKYNAGEEFADRVENAKYHREWCSSATVAKNASSRRVVDWKYDSFAKINVNTPITSYNDPDLNNMKTLINSGHILAFETDMVEWIFRYDGATQAKYKGYYVIVRHQQDLKKDWNGHVLCIVGYDDNVWFDLNKNGTKEAYECGAFKIANSWGKTWPDIPGYPKGDGFAWVMYDALNKVSNVPSLNVPGREEIVGAYEYAYIDKVATTPPALSAKVTVKQKRRNEFFLVPAGAKQNVPLDMINGGSYNFDGTNSTTEQKHTYYVAIDPLEGFGTGWEFEPWTLAVYKWGNNTNNTKVEQVQFLNRYGGVFKTFAEKTLTGPNIDYVLFSGAFSMTFSNGVASISGTLKSKDHKDILKFVPQKSGKYTFFASPGFIGAPIGIYKNLTVKLLDSSQRVLGEIPAASATYSPSFYSLTAGKTYYISVQSPPLAAGATQSYNITIAEPEVMMAICF